MSKDEILELYLDHIYFGRGRYGIEEAARDSFGKSAKDLSIAEAALLAGTIACPESCSPRKDPKRALERRAFVPVSYTHLDVYKRQALSRDIAVQVSNLMITLRGEEAD